MKFRANTLIIFFNFEGARPRGREDYQGVVTAAQPAGIWQGVRVPDSSKVHTLAKLLQVDEKVSLYSSWDVRCR